VALAARAEDEKLERAAASTRMDAAPLREILGTRRLFFMGDGLCCFITLSKATAAN
jgi:glycerol uptake facilitator-like aquaporin